MYNHWTQALDAALVATYVTAKTLDKSMEEARQYILHEVMDHYDGDFDDYCFNATFGSTVKVPYKKTLEEVLTPILAEHGMTWEEFQKQQRALPKKDKVLRSLYLSVEIDQALAALATERNVTKSSLMRKFLKEGLERISSRPMVVE